MKIDYERLLQLLLPTFLRTGLRFIIQALAYPFKQLYAEFELWQTDIRIQAAVTCQVMYLELILNYRLLGTFDRLITISNGDGITVDFNINIPDNKTVDGAMLIALVDKYKTYGKRYQIENIQQLYGYEWNEPVCELNSLTYQYDWINPVCEQVNEKRNNGLVLTTEGGTLTVTADYPVTAQMVIEVRLQAVGETMVEVMYMNFGESVSVSHGYDSILILEAGISRISPTEDDNYNYYIK